MNKVTDWGGCGAAKETKLVGLMRNYEELLLNLSVNFNAMRKIPKNSPLNDHRFQCVCRNQPFPVIRSTNVLVKTEALHK